MSLRWATRAGPLRPLRLGVAFSRPTSVIAVQNQLRRVCLATKPRLAIPQAGSLSAPTSQRSRSFTTATATDGETPKAKRGPKPGSGKKPKKAKAKKPKKRLTEKQKAAKETRDRRAQIKELKAIALVPPKKLTASAWPLAVKEQFQGVKSEPGTTVEKFSEAIARVKGLSQDEYKKVEAQAEKNRATNKANYKAWVKSYTPNQIKDANGARRFLSRLLKKRVPPIEDDRLVKRPKTAYFIFMLERKGGSDLKHKGGPELTRIIGEEWGKLTEYEKEAYQKKQAEDRARYEREHLEVYGEPAPSLRSKEDVDSDE
ncbi:hypothetical protein PENDEC_c002G02720 [Penicillium decumbens]|uniref:HMG box domain-containing protein n=1 Tax=Penicillium decumbens TaxID=69771 RepID=A0A1V6PLP6_PENDC|nr:hypothetical protein PENDEC_c002G02720 [Penicillium decumbens]